MMRKSKRSNAWEKSSAGASKDLEAELGGFDEEIIDLEEIVEPHADAIEEDDELAFDVEILDAEAGLGFGDIGSNIESEDEFLLEDDLLQELPFFQEQKVEPEPPPAVSGVREKPEDFPLGLLPGSGEDPLDHAASSGEALAPEKTKLEEGAPAIATPVEASVSLDELIAQMEGRLVEVVREMVES